MSRILLLTHRLPLPPNRGDKIRSYHLLRHLAARHQVAVACPIDDARDLAHLPALAEICEQVLSVRIDGGLAKLRWPQAFVRGEAISAVHFHSAELQAQIDDLLDRTAFDAVFCYSAPMANYVFRSRHRERLLGQTTLLADLIDVDSEKWADYAASARPPVSWVYRRESAQLARLEAEIVARFDAVYLTTADEVGLLRGRLPDSRTVQVLANGVDLAFYDRARAPAPPAGRPPGPAIVFTGVMDYAPNVDAVCWFADEILPAVRRRVRDAHFVIVGSRPNAAVQALAGRAAVTVTGFVDDVRGDLAAAAVCVAPLRIARGVQNKVLEAMAMAQPVVCTSAAATGIDVLPGRDLFVADDPAGFADKVCELLGDRALAARAGDAARAFVERHHRWEANLAVLDRVLPVAAVVSDEVVASHG
ncbi:MAG: TIGR03087 family PEP-CTERM/XrtA system glycosyltransferase [Burkholderiaceae bacterium]